MNKRTFSALLVASALATLGGCTTQPANDTNDTQVTQQQAQSFKQATDAFIEDLWQESPSWALYEGYHKYAHILPIPDEAGRQSTLAFVEKQRARFAPFNVDSLNPNERTDYYLIKNQLDSIEWSIKKFKSHQWMPSNYNVAGGFSRIFNGDYDTLDNRLRSALKRLENVPAYYQAAIKNITVPTLEHTTLGITQNKGALSVFGESLNKQIAESGLSTEEKSQFEARLVSARDAINGYVKHLETLKTTLEKNGNARSFRIGSDLYEQKFALNIQSEYSAKQMYDKAMADKNNVLRKMAKLADQLWPKYFKNHSRPKDDNVAISELIKKISVRHVKRDDFVEEIRQQIPALEAFVKEKDLISIDPEKPLVVRATPEYMRGFAGASVSAPGPYDKKANTYYNVTPLDNMNDEQAESYLREYNHWMLQILNIHEAIPGHYTQLVYANESPSLIKAILGNGAMVEGWAVYTEIMMLEEGYGDFEKEMWLMYYKWNLRVIANTILDYSIHNLDWNKDQVLDLLMNQVFQEKAEAEGKWRRATLSQVQLTSYYSGYREIYDFREELKRKSGENFDLKQFHETFLSYGSSPVKYIKQLMRK